MPYPGYNKNKRGTQDVQPEPICRAHRQQIDTAGKTENFLTRNVRLLTFIACMMVIVAIMLGFGIYRAKNYGDLAQEPENMMEMEQLQTLIAKGSKLTWRDFDGYSREVVSDSIVYVCRYHVKDGEYYLMVTSETEGTSIISVILVDLATYEQTEIFAPDQVQ
jgi:hypothetical protein